MKQLHSMLLVLFAFCAALSARADNAPSPLPGSVTKALHILEADHPDDPTLRLRLTSLNGEYAAALATLEDLRKSSGDRFQLMHYELYLKARLTDGAFESALATVFDDVFSPLDNHAAYDATYYTGYDLDLGAQQIAQALHAAQNEDMGAQAAANLIRRYQDHAVYALVLPGSAALMQADLRRRYNIRDDALIHTPDGATLSATVVRNRSATLPQPTAMAFTIYTRENRNLREAIHAAAHGYAGVVADARGKRLSSDTIRPYETEGADVNAVIDWVANQPWSDGRVAMYGGSYNGFVQWASLKAPHPALKTIVPYVAAIPGMGLPMENNIFLNANYGWAFYVTGNRTLDNAVYFDPVRWRTLNDTWFKSGRPYRDIDAVDGTPNPWLQRWLDHPSYDAYWQAMAPFGPDFADIDIPVLTITGYYDDGQGSALHYMAEHERHHPNPEHYLVIGPYDHFSAQGTQGENLRGYTLDAGAHINTPELTFEWMDHILKGTPKPGILKGKVNYQLMDDDSWRHAPSLGALHKNMQRFYLSPTPAGAFHSLSTIQPNEEASLGQSIDLTQRETEYNDYYPWPIIRDELALENGYAYVSAPLEEDMIFAGRFSGALKVRINKKDVDVGITLYEIMPDGRAFHLSYYLGRASYAHDMTTRRLLKPGTVETIPFERSRMVAKKLAKGSRIAAVVNVNMNAFAQVNYGTGKDVSDESIVDAGEPLLIEWLNDSYIELPLRPYSPQ
ncbi:CocE/NonD family hydrolase [Kordiimonas sp.]|uniref:CocE/NonD family hydrolase n=1 Tax=Kordiimonas sp. TaxID=1970157 RepID=UPI003A95B1F6